MEKYLQISPYVYNCKTCPTPCSAVSKMSYFFNRDLQFSEHYEQLLINHINVFTVYKAQKSTLPGYPDIEIRNTKGEIFYIEVKVQRRTFMTVENVLPNANLKPSETVALNHSDLLRYFYLAKSLRSYVFIFWVVLNRPCILGENEIQFYYRLATELKPIWQAHKNTRKFTRKSGDGDEVNGKHLGVTVNFHFSLNELKRWNNSLFW